MPGLTPRQKRGRDTQQIVARYFRRNGWVYATAVTGAVSGRDILNMPAMAPEVKATQASPGLGAIRQAKGNAHADDLAFVIWRPNGHGETTVSDWPVLLTLEDFTRLARQAGYGDPIPGGNP